MTPCEVNMRILTCAILLLSPVCLCQEKPRVMIAKDESWRLVDGTGGSDDRTLKITRLLLQKCPHIIVTADKSKAAYVIQTGKSDHGVPRTIFQYSKNDVAVFRVNGDLLFTGSAGKLDNAVKDACSAILKDLK